MHEAITHILIKDIKRYDRRLHKARWLDRQTDRQTDGLG